MSIFASCASFLGTGGPPLAIVPMLTLFIEAI
jgi:hypothetical protein